MNTPFLAENADFVCFGFQHVAVILFTFIFGTSLIFYARNYLDEIGQHHIGNIIAWTLTLTIVFWTIIEYYVGLFEYKIDLPLYLCNIMALLMPVFSHKRSKLMYEILFFWVFAGTLQGIITPDLPQAFPNYTFFKYWIVHLGLVLMMFYATFVYGFRPTLKSGVKSWLALQVAFVFFMALNYLLDANYNYLNAKPEAGSVLDYMGDWPWYLLTGQLVVIPLFLLIYLPFAVFGKKE